ncbi:mercury transporter [Intrasporangium chromatireducens Q5-1]|uniref:Mercury transporter n=1 Tax=Intrasporangium chromatireducens Q5-1 TaxID=584657 RepID=W9GH36_9MICO|nr:cytochrome c biogenesis protein CcdA [Intrasporangium chromatireducens]EWT04133.1 mercury transporter [Intrasporangium chromatireducens Q5-1]
MDGLLALAFAAGMVAPVNPCGFALLPAWITHTLGEADTSPAPIRMLHALRAAAALAIGFAGTLSAAGLVVSVGARGLIQAAPWLGLTVGIILVLLGAAMLADRTTSLRLPGIPVRATEGFPATVQMVVFGVGYATASLSCTFGVLLAVIAQAQATASYSGLLVVFASYAAGSTTVLLLLALVTAALGTALTRRVTALARYGPRITAIVLLATGGYLAWYWYPAASGDQLSAGHAGGLSEVSATTSHWIQAHTTAIAMITLLAALTATAWALRHRLRGQHLPARPPTGIDKPTSCSTDAPVSTTRDTSTCGPRSGGDCC